MSDRPKRERKKPDKFVPYAPGDKHKLNAERTKKSKELKKDRERKKMQSKTEEPAAQVDPNNNNSENPSTM